VFYLNELHDFMLIYVICGALLYYYIVIALF